MTLPEIWPMCEGYILQDTCAGVAQLVATYMFTSEDGPVQVTYAICNACHHEMQADSVGPDGDTRLYFQRVEVWRTYKESP